MVTVSVGEEEVVDLVNRYRKGALSTCSVWTLDTNGHVTKDEVVDVIKEKCDWRGVSFQRGEGILVDEIVGHKRCNKEDELSRGVVSSDGTDEESGSDITSIIVAKKEKSAQGGKDKKSEKSKEKE
ncbi:unnamed protein product [Rhizophagus irregularis]|nr:hypothetical protein RhiirB3_390011 [Rhizophagus irregularis]CAB5217427.1 unnamed protein product [Rhizophagus irregularis]